MSIKIMTWVWDNSPYKDAALLMHLALADWCNDEGVCWPAQPTIARKIRCSSEHVRRLTRRMEKDGLLIIDRPSTGKGVSHLYRLVISSPTFGGARASSPTSDRPYPHNPSTFPPHLSPKNRHDPSENPPSDFVTCPGCGGKYVNSKCHNGCSF